MGLKFSGINYEDQNGIEKYIKVYKRRNHYHEFGTGEHHCFYG